MRKILPLISQLPAAKENLSGASDEMLLVGHRARLEDTGATPAP